MKSNKGIVLVLVVGLAIILGFALWELLESRSLSTLENNLEYLVDEDVMYRGDLADLPLLPEVPIQASPDPKVVDLQKARYTMVESPDEANVNSFILAMKSALWEDTLTSYSIGDFEQVVSTIYCTDGIVNIVLVYFENNGIIFVQLIRDDQTIRVDYVITEHKPITCDYIPNKGFLIGCIDPNYESFDASTQAYYLEYSKDNAMVEVVDTIGLLFTVENESIWAIDEHHNKYILDINTRPLLFMPFTTQ